MSTTTALSTPSPVAIRAELERLVVADLLGPAGGPNEVLTDPRERVSTRYLVGMLAPKGTMATEPGRHDDGGTVGDDAVTDPAEEGGAAAKASLFPSSFGLTFAVCRDATQLQVDVTWGRYAREKQEGAEPVWQRYPLQGEARVTLREGLIEATPVNASEAPGVIVRGRCTRRDGAWLVSLFLVNEQPAPERNKDEAWLFQPALAVSVGDGAAVFVGRREAMPDRALAQDEEARELDLLFREHVEFAVGHGVAVHATRDPRDPARAVRIETRSAPTYEVPRVEAPSADEEPGLTKVVLDMRRLAELDGAELQVALLPLADAYDRWLDAREAAIPSLGLGQEGEAVARATVVRAREVAARLRVGIAVVSSGSVVTEAFRFANRAMWQQRVRTVAVARRKNAGDRSIKDLLAESDVPEQRSWRPFQLAFLLVNIPSLADPNLKHPERSQTSGLVDLLFFPTGGGKTEAYLGLTAFTLAMRRLQGQVGGYDGSGGVAVLMRYTLRLLTAQQFQRATALICACEVIRRERLAAGDTRWGDTPFRIGMWVGGTVTPNYSEAARRAIEDLFGAGGARAGRAPNPVQIVSCPWCGHQKLMPTGDKDRWRTTVHCGDELGECDFSGRKSPDEGVPVVTVDEEIYRLLPALVIATVDKFAQLPWQGPLHTLFGRVEKHCSRHGYRTTDLDKISSREERDAHNAVGSLPKAKTSPCLPLRPLDLIVQDELHLIAGPLGTMVGLYESAIDTLASWTLEGTLVRPKVIASTATIRRAADQVHALFWRQIAVFPPQVLDVGNSFFARTRSTEQTPGRLYLGICAPGVRLKSVETRVFATVLAAAQVLYRKYGRLADPWMTMVGYFNALRELGGARRIIEDEVTNRLKRTERKGLANRARPILRELTSRVASGDIPQILDQLGLTHDPDRRRDSSVPIDVLLATNMISVGVDVPRLGLMVAVGQPKATAEYIQATSRVGRDTLGPGLVVTVYNWARPRDLSYYEAFEHYHATFYRHVEALSVTPFAPRALDRGLSALLVSMVRHRLLRWNPNRAAQDVNVLDPAVEAFVAELVERAGSIATDAGAGERVRHALQRRLDAWLVEQQRLGAPLAYRDVPNQSAIPLLKEPTPHGWTIFTCPTSMREVEANVNLILDRRDPAVSGAAPAYEAMPAENTTEPATPSTHDDDVAEELTAEVLA